MQQKTDVETNAHRRVLAFSHAWTHGCFLALGYCCRGLGFHHSFIRGNLPFLSAQKDSHRNRGGYPRPAAPKSAKQPLFPAQGPLLAPALVDGYWVWPRGPRTPLCCSAGAAHSNTPPQSCLSENFVFPIY